MDQIEIQTMTWHMSS